MGTDVEGEKWAAAETAAELVEDGMRVGLGTGSTVAYLLPALARRNVSITSVATSPGTADLATRLGIRVEPFGPAPSGLDRLDLAIDGADQIAPDGWLVKGGGGAHTREKLVAASAGRFVVIVDSTKPVDRLHAPVPLEVMAFGLASTLRRLGSVAVRDAPATPDGGVLVDYTGMLDDPAALAAWFDAVPGVVAHGLFPASLVTSVLVGRGAVVERIDVGGGLG
jgi:ribose 5-phosphate isomerase A